MTQQVSFHVYPWRSGSRSARALADALGGKVLRREGSRFRPRENRKVVNWGASDCPWECLNHPDAIKVCSNKLSFFRHIENLDVSPQIVIPRLPTWYDTREEALNQHSVGLVARTILNGHSGAGIVYKDRDHLDELPEAPLYVEYIPKDAEYRVHVFDGEVIDVQRKVKDPDREVQDWKVRSHSNGFIYTRRNSEGEFHRDVCPPDVLEQAKRAVACSGLTFGGVDVLWNRHRNQAFVVEVNTAVGLEGATAGIYADAIKRYYNVG